MNLLTETHQELSSYLSQLENLKQQMDFILKNFRPVFDGEVRRSVSCYISPKEPYSNTEMMGYFLISKLVVKFSLNKVIF